MIAVLPCRALRFRHNMWSTGLSGKSLLKRKLEVLSSSSILDYIIVASDNEDVCQVISEFDDERIIFFKRSKEETLRSVPITITLRKIISKFDPEAKGITFLTYCSSPFVTKQTIEESIHTLIYNEADSCVGVEEMTDIIYQRTAFGLQPINEPSVFTTDHDSLYRTLNVAVTTKNSLIKKGAIHGPVTVHFVMDSPESFFIDSDILTELPRLCIMKKDKLGIVVSSRISSSRLPGKALYCLGGKSVLSFLIDRLAPVCPDVPIILATTSNPEDDVIREEARSLNIPCYSGSSSDVALRYLCAADLFDLDYIIRVTADCPFLDNHLASFCIQQFFDMNKPSFMTTKGVFPVGLDLEFLSTACLRDAYPYMNDHDKEHLTSYFYNPSNKLKLDVIYFKPPTDLPPTNLKYTLDTPEDYSFARSLVACLDCSELSAYSLFTLPKL